MRTSPFGSRLQAGDKLPQRVGGKPLQLRNYHRFMSSKAFFVNGSRRHQRNSNKRRRLGAAVAKAFLKFPKFSTQPAFVCRSVKDERRIARPEVFVVIVPDFSGVAVEDRPDHFEALFKQEVRPCGRDLGVPLIVDQVNSRDRKSTRLNSSHPSISYA